MDTLGILRHELRQISEKYSFAHDSVVVSAGPLSVREAIGTTKRTDYPLLQGREVMLEADFRGAKGQAFTDAPGEYSGSLKHVLDLPLQTNAERALFIASLNAVLRAMGETMGTRHCRDAGPETCAINIASSLHNRFGKIDIGLIGLQPAILESLATWFGPGNVRVTDLDPMNIGAEKYGTMVEDGRTMTNALIRESEVLLVTGTTIVNGSFDSIYQQALGRKRPCYFFGVTIAGAAAVLGLNRFCTCAT